MPAVVVVLLVYGSLAATMGMLLGNFGRTEAQVVGLGVIASNVLAGLGGCWWPIEITPMWTQKLALVFPTGWTMDALHKLMNFGAARGAAEAAVKQARSTSESNDFDALFRRALKLLRP